MPAMLHQAEKVSWYSPKYNTDTNQSASAYQWNECQTLLTAYNSIDFTTLSLSFIDIPKYIYKYQYQTTVIYLSFNYQHQTLQNEAQVVVCKVEENTVVFVIGLYIVSYLCLACKQFSANLIIH